MTSKVQGLSSPCPQSVEILSKPKVNWQTLDMEIQSLSRHCPLEHLQQMSFLTVYVFWTNFGHRQTLDKPWICHLAHCPPIDCSCLAWTKFGQILDLDKLWTKQGFVNLPPYAFLDKVWTNFGHGLTLDKPWICQLAHCPPIDCSWLAWTKFRPILDLDKVRTKSGLNMDLSTCHFMPSWTKFGQNLDLDKLGTNPVFVFSSITLVLTTHSHE